MYASKGLMQSHLASYRGVLARVTQIQIYKGVPPTDAFYLTSGIFASTHAANLLATIAVVDQFKMTAVEAEKKWRFTFKNGNIPATWSGTGEATWAVLRLGNGGAHENAICSVGTDELSVMRISATNAVAGQPFVINSFNLVLTRKV